VGQQRGVIGGGRVRRERKIGGLSSLSGYAPFIFLSDGSLLLRGKIVFDVKSLTNLLRGLSFDHRGYLGAGEVEKGSDVHEVSSQNDFKKDILFAAHKVYIPGVQGGS